MNSNDKAQLKLIENIILKGHDNMLQLSCMADSIIHLRDSLSFEDDNWYYLLTDQIATLDSASSFNPSADERRELDFAVENAKNNILNLVRSKLEC
jgi:hypothetical protein